MACGGGYDYKLVDEVGKDMYCVICTSLIKRATMFHCGHAFCNLCIVDFMQSSIQRNVKVQCPMRCEKDIYPLVPIPAFDRLISSLNVYCENQNMGCNWKGEISNVEDHLQKACDFREVLCKNCGTVVLHKNLQNHLADCVSCPNKCGKKMSKNEVVAHLTICPTQLVSCPFHNVGCSVSVPRNSIERHLKLSINDHLLLVAADSQKTKAEILQSEQLQQQKVNELQQEIKLLKESDRLQQQQIEDQQKKMDLLEEGEKLRQQQMDEQKVNELQQEIKLLKESDRLQQQQMEGQQKKMDLLEEGGKLRQQQMDEQSQEIKILKEKFEEQELKITKLTKKDEDQQKETNLLKEKEKNQQMEIQERKETVKKNQDLLQSSPEIQKHLQEISKQGFRYIYELLENENTSLSTFELLLTHNPHIIDMRDDFNNSPIIHDAAYFNRADVLVLLLSVYPSHVDDVNDNNNTALMWAVRQNNIECVRVLLDNNADVSIKTRDGDTPLSLALKNNNVDIFRLLMEHRKQHRTAR